MRRIPLLHLWLCALLSLQQPSVLIQMGTWLRGSAQVDVEDAPTASWSEESKLPGLRSGGGHRLKAEVTRQWKCQPPSPFTPKHRSSGFVPASFESGQAIWHWRAALLPPRVPPDDEQRVRG